MNPDVDREEEEGVPEDVEKEARNMGWVPEEEFKGNKDHWVDAPEFVERGRTVMPILLQNNRRLQKELLTRDAKIGTLEARLQNSEKVMEKLEKHYTETNKRAVALARNQLKEDLKQAREDNDVDKELTITDQLADLKKREDAIEEPETKPASFAPKYTPEFSEWYERNQWFGKDKKRTKQVSRIAEDLREEGTDLVGVEFLDECVRLLEDQSGEIEEEEETEKPVRRTNGKVESTPLRRTPRGGSKGWADLPSEAKRACDDDAEDLVGPDKRYKTKKDWREAYAKIYFAE